MIDLSIDAVRFELDKKTRRYVRRKLGRLDRFISKTDREGLKAKVVLIQNDSQPKERYKCEVRIHVKPRDLFVSQATVVNMHTAIDQVEEKLKRQLHKTKTKKLDARHHARRVTERFKRFGR